MAKVEINKLIQLNEATWIKLGNMATELLPFEKAINCYEMALRNSPFSPEALNGLATCYRNHELYPQAAEVYQRLINLLPQSGETWGALGHCYLMMDELQKAYSAYQQALYYLKNPREPKLWYGIGILYDRYGSFEHAEEALCAVLQMDPNFEKANEIYFRLGIISKQQGKYKMAIECLEYILNNPPPPLTKNDVYFQLGHVYEQQLQSEKAKQIYESILLDNPNHSKVLQQLGWLYQDTKTNFHDSEKAVSLLLKSLEVDAKDAQSWYLLGRCYMHQQKYNEAYDAYQQAVYRDNRNPTFWCSIGVLYYQINQFSDALDAYGRALRLNPYISEVWYDLGTLYESCNNQIPDAIDAYTRALELDPNNAQIKQRLNALKQSQSGQKVPIPTTGESLPKITPPSVSPGGTNSGAPQSVAPPSSILPNNMPAPNASANISSGQQIQRLAAPVAPLENGDGSTSSTTPIPKMDVGKPDPSSDSLQKPTQARTS